MVGWNKNIIQTMEKIHEKNHKFKSRKRYKFKRKNLLLKYKLKMKKILKRKPSKVLLFSNILPWINKFLCLPKKLTQKLMKWLVSRMMNKNYAKIMLTQILINAPIHFLYLKIKINFGDISSMKKNWLLYILPLKWDILQLEKNIQILAIQPHLKT